MVDSSISARRATPAFIGPVLIGAGLCLLVVMGLVERHVRAVRADAIYTTGAVVAILPHRSNGSTAYAPLVRFRTESGAQLDFTATSSSNPPSYRTGDRVRVIYSKLNPTDADIDSWTARWIKTILLGALAVLCLTSGIVALRGAGTPR